MFQWKGRLNMGRSAFLALLALTLSAVPAEAQEVCQGFKEYQRIGVLGGPNAFSKEKPDSTE